ncbi:MAG: sensor domain-containing diguanylate cyclase [Pyrinomonadaceae bacterium]|nr:sensor domain-containing diguanylate cyclase [Pyrinomonadaceae bacterium]
MNYVILLTDAHETPATALLDFMHGAGISTLVEVLRQAQPAHTSAAHGSKDEIGTPDQPLAVLYEVAAGASPEELYAAVRHAAGVWPGVPLVACRNPVGNQARRGQRIFDGTTLKRLGFRTVADDPTQLPALLRKLEERGTTGDLILPAAIVETDIEPDALVLLPERLKPSALRGAFELVASLHFANDQKSAAHTALAGFAALVPADRWTIYLTAETSGGEALSLEPLAVRGLTESERAIPETDWRRALMGDALAMSGAESQAAREAVTSVETALRIENGRRVIAVPMVNGERLLAVLEAVREGQAALAFKKSEVELINALTVPVASALANSVRIAEAEKLSQTDDLTKLHNARYLRHYLLNEVKRARRYHSSVTALFLDLDDFKRINDEHGHLVGSHVLMEMAMIILSSVRDTDVVARYGGDEFVIVLPETDLEMAAVVAERVRVKIANHAFTGGRRLRLTLTASFGVANFPHHAQSPQQLIAAADSAMYEAKAARKNCVRFAPAHHADKSGAGSQGSGVKRQFLETSDSGVQTPD